MIASKHITKIVAVVTALALLLCLGAMALSDELTEALGGTGVSQEYEARLFDTSDIVSVDILMDEDDWAEMLESAASEVYYQCDVVINGTTFYSVGIRPKGNTSLSSIVSDPTNDRYSFKLEFDRFVDGQTCWGLDKLILNNNYADATNMKEAVVYDMFRYLGADASLYNYAEVSVNGGYWGVYLALEAVEDSFLLRNYGVESGALYKPDSMEQGGDQGIGRGETPTDFDDSQFEGKMPDDGEMPEVGNRQGGFPGGATPEGFDAENMPENFDAEGMPEGFDGEAPDMSGFDMSDFGGKGGGFSMGSGGGADLNYSDDELDSYSTIWDGSVSESSERDHRAVVTALKNISEGTELETYLDVDNILKYMAVHSFVVNEDSLSGSMAHNYYLYEYDGKLNLLPWDYNLAFGGMGQSGGASGVINDPIDTPFSGTEFFDSLLENEEYLERYHEYYRLLVEEYVLGGGFDETYAHIRAQIDSLVETDPNAMYTYEEYEAGAEMLYDTVMLRAESVLGQLDGTIPSTGDGQSADPSALIDASAIDITIMGTFSGGGQRTDEFASVQRGEAPTASRSGMTGLPAQGGGEDGAASAQNVSWLIVSLALAISALLFAGLYRRRKRK